MRLLLRSALLIAAVALSAGSAEADTKDGSKTVTNGAVSATLSWKGSPDIVAQGAHITISRNGAAVTDEALKKACKLCEYLGTPNRSLHIRDLNGDGEPEVFVDTYTGGAHCCSSIVVYRFDGTTYKHLVNYWGNGFYRLKDLDADGKPEFVTDDDRFAYEFSAYAFSYRPLMILDFGSSGFTDVTKAFPKRVLAEIRSIDKLLPDARMGGDPRGLIAARAADMATVGQSAAKIGAYLDREIRRGDAQGDKLWPRDKKFKTAVLKFLRKTGYL
jgi:hypothetical protein